jgi:pyruvate dehydrogenase E2 component (dihydrolipoamide acetyltransferase)
MQIEMPQLGETVAEGTITVWHKAVGDRVAAGDALFEVETDKASMEVPSISAGILTEIRVPAGQVAPVGAVVGVIAGENAAKDPAPATERAVGTQALGVTATSAAPAARPASETRPPASAPISKPARRMTPFTEVVSSSGGYGPARLSNGVTVTPYARRLASELNVPLSQLKPGNSQRITASVVLAHPRTGSQNRGSPQSVAGQYEAGMFTVQPVDSMRSAIARRLTESHTSAPIFHLTMDIEMSGIVARRARLNASGAESDKVSITDILVSHWAAALKAVPAANVVWNGQEILAFSRVDIGVAVALGGGLVSPVLRNADGMSVAELSKALQDLTARARGKRLKESELQGGVSSVSNLGMYGVRQFDAIINPPQSSILALGAIQRRPVEDKDGKLLFAPMLTATLTCDHRVIDGALGAQVMAKFQELAQHT